MTPLVMVSGGVDSTTLAYWLWRLNRAPRLVFINYGQHCAEAELSAIRTALPPTLNSQLSVVDIRPVYLQSRSILIREPDLWTDTVVDDDLLLPYRNLLLITVAAAYAETIGCDRLYAAFIASDRVFVEDASTRFLRRVRHLLATVGKVSLRLPLSRLTKSDVVRLGVSVGAPLELTYSCQASSTIACGACPNCVDRRLAFLDVAESVP